MATENQMQTIDRIMRLCMQISVQGKYHVFAGYSGHIDKFEVYAYPSDNDYQSGNPAYVEGLACQEWWIPLGSEDGQLAKLQAVLEPLLDRDDDGVPL